MGDVVQHKRVRVRRRDGGFSLIELLVTIAIMSILAGAAAPIVAQQIDAQRYDDTRTAVLSIYNSIWGTREAAGFVADVGRLPTVLGELNSQGMVPNSTTATQNNVRMGYTGPYVFQGFNAATVFNDKWGNAYLFSTAGGLASGQIRSAGADREFGTNDDITYPTSAYVANGTVIVNLNIWHSAAGTFATNPAFSADAAQTTTVTLYYSNEGAQASTVKTSSAMLSPPFTFTNVHRGFHAIVASSTYKGASPALTTSVVVFVEGNANQTAVDINLGGP